MNILVTGAIGQLGFRVYAHLVDAGVNVRGVSRRGGDHVEQLDLLTHPDLSAPLTGVDVIVHCAQGMGKSDVLMAHRLAQSSRQARVGHLVAISIVGIDEIPLGFYKQRLLIELALTAGFPRLTIQRATQFHTLIETLFNAQRFSPTVFVPRARVQPIDVDEVAARLSDLALGEPQGRVDDIGGPQIATFAEFFEEWNRVCAKPRHHIGFRLPGKIFRALSAGANLAEPYGVRTFSEFLEARAGT